MSAMVPSAVNIPLKVQRVGLRQGMMVPPELRLCVWNGVCIEGDLIHDADTRALPVNNKSLGFHKYSVSSAYRSGRSKVSREKRSRAACLPENGGGRNKKRGEIRPVFGGRDRLALALPAPADRVVKQAPCKST